MQELIASEFIDKSVLSRVETASGEIKLNFHKPGDILNRHMAACNKKSYPKQKIIYERKYV